jgi:hypothetical protein
VAQEPGAEEALEALRPEEADLSELDYQSPSDSDIGSMEMNPAGNSREVQTPQRQKMSFSRQSADDQKQNRAERRKLKKR